MVAFNFSLHQMGGFPECPKAFLAVPQGEISGATCYEKLGDNYLLREAVHIATSSLLLHS